MTAECDIDYFYKV